MQTKQLYLDDSYLREMNAKLLDVKPEGQGKWRLLLDQTIFYPMGGGQPTDQGKLSSSLWNGEVYLTMMKDGEIWHYVNAGSELVIGTSLKGEIDWVRRYKNMKVHSAGHVIDFAMYLLGYSPKLLMPYKGDHGKKPCIVYQGKLNEDIKQKLEDKSNELIQKNLKFSWLFQPFEELQKEAIYLQPGLPKNKPLRTLRLETVGAVADGGTQVHNTKEVGKIIIESIENRGWETDVHYRIE